MKLRVAQKVWFGCRDEAKASLRPSLYIPRWSRRTLEAAVRRIEQRRARWVARGRRLLTENDVRALLEAGVSRAEALDEKLRPLFTLDAATAGLVLDGAATPHKETKEPR